MEPKLPSPDRGPEIRSTVPAQNGEALSFSPDHESLPAPSFEHAEQRSEATPLASPPQPQVVVLPTPVSVPVSSDDSVATSLSGDDDTPTSASVNELIEKEWVNKAKKVISETKDDPYRREQEVNKLQADYLFKRYGRKLGSPQ